MIQYYQNASEIIRLQRRIEKLILLKEQKSKSIRILQRIKDEETKTLALFNEQLQECNSNLKAFNDKFSEEFQRRIRSKNELTAKKSVVQAVKKLNRYRVAQIFFNKTAIKAFHFGFAAGVNYADAQQERKQSAALGMLAFLALSIAKIEGFTLVNLIKFKGSRTTIVKSVKGKEVEFPLFALKQGQVNKMADGRNNLLQNLKHLTDLLGLCKGQMKSAANLTSGLYRFLCCDE